MNLRDAAHIVDASASTVRHPLWPDIPLKRATEETFTYEQRTPLPRRRTLSMILAEIESTLARTHALLRELQGRLPNE